MSKLVMMRGLAGSGKSTIAKELVEKKGFVRVNKDDLRQMMSNGVWNGKREKRVVAIRDFIIGDVLESGGNVVVDDTNYGWEDRLREMAKEYGAVFEIIDVDTDVEECIKRDLKRTNSVGERVIRRMYVDHVEQIPVREFREDLPSCFCVDLDGTLAHTQHIEGKGTRDIYDGLRVDEDARDESVAHLIWRISSIDHVIILSGRGSECRDLTIKWLNENNVNYDELLMRPEGDKRPDYVVKKEIFENEIDGKYNVIGIFDDRPSVCRMWRSLGLKVFQVGDPHYEF